MSDAAIAAEPVNVPGTGHWSVDLCLMYSCAARRLAVRGFLRHAGYAAATGIEVPRPEAPDALGDPFRPERSVVD
jgi:hypothetical protein